MHALQLSVIVQVAVEKGKRKFGAHRRRARRGIGFDAILALHD
jgi:hypothetical protein